MSMQNCQRLSLLLWQFASWLQRASSGSGKNQWNIVELTHSRGLVRPVAAIRSSTSAESAAAAAVVVVVVVVVVAVAVVVVVVRKD